MLTQRLHDGLDHFLLGLQHRTQARYKEAGGHLKLAL